ncbi:hypothetical protein SAMN03159496_05903 [Rhizobium sp. NFR07]|uniref:hypothetical protein n=1 Tax=Rhizobium sp. NFR07 TaxID=1566262 RepID=UPI0008E541C5|nr:hypothetical protein [Rhizobium sp. NFR07]SFB61783.1 hypothetical protein SAMN03159496_05903 [Rhizobium sp. NFR07]
MDQTLDKSVASSAVDARAGSIPPRGDRQRAEVEISFTENARLRASVDVSSGGLLSIAALVSSKLLSTAVLVHVATRDARSKSLWR